MRRTFTAQELKDNRKKQLTIISRKIVSLSKARYNNKLTEEDRKEIKRHAEDCIGYIIGALNTRSELEERKNKKI